MNLRVGLGALVFLAGVVACSGGTGSSSSGTVPGGGTDRAAFVDEFCNAIGQCCARVNKPANPAQCKQLLDQLAGQLEYDGAKGTQCLASVRSRQGSPAFCDDVTPDDSCNGVFREKGASGGTKQLGEACEKDGDCVSSPEGKVDCTYAGANKFCQVSIEFGREGDGPCSYTKDGNTSTSETSGSAGSEAGTTNPPRAYVCNVADGLYCQNGQACTKIGAPGQPCSTSNYSSFQCGKNGFCDYKSKTCIERLGVGGDCSTSSNICREDTRCDTTSRKCVAKLADGQPCESSLDCTSERCTNKVCAAKSSGDDESLKLFCGQ